MKISKNKNVYTIYCEDKAEEKLIQIKIEKIENIVQMRKFLNKHG